MERYGAGLPRLPEVLQSRICGMQVGPKRSGGPTSS